VLNPKSEGRNPKSERNPKTEYRKGHPFAVFLRISDFGLLSGFGFRVSDLRAFLPTLLVLVTGCVSLSDKPLHRFESSSPHMGTRFSLTLYASDQTTADAAAAAAFHRVAELESVMSDYDVDSELLRLCAQPFGRPVAVSEDLFDVLERAQKFSALSDGAFDVTIGPCVRLWRFSRKRNALPAPAEMARARAAVGWRKVRLDRAARTVTLLAPDMRLDLGGIGKGYAADAALKVLRSHGIRRALVAASGDIAIGDPPPGRKGWRIGIAPIDAKANEAAEFVLLRNAGVSTSGDTEQFVEIDGVRYSHDLDPATGLGLTNRIQATVIARDATTSDALCKPVCVLGPERGLALIDSLPGAAAVVFAKGNSDRTIGSRRFHLLPKAR